MKSIFAATALLAAITICPAAFADSLCPSSAGQNGSGSYTFTPGSGCSETISLPNSTDYARLAWVPGDTGYPADLTIGNLGGITASVAFTAGTDEPFYMLAFTDSGDSFLNTTTGDQILLIEFQGSTLSGAGDGTMVLDPTTTQFNLYDNTLGQYLESGQSDTNSLDGWIALDPNLSSDDVQQIRLGLGLSGGSGPAESLTVNSADVTEATATPEPSCLLLLGAGLFGIAGLLLWKGRKDSSRPGLIASC